MVHVKSPARSVVTILKGSAAIPSGKVDIQGHMAIHVHSVLGQMTKEYLKTNRAFWLNRPNAIVIYNRSVVILEYCCCRSVGFICGIEELPEVVGVKL